MDLSHPLFRSSLPIRYEEEVAPRTATSWAMTCSTNGVKIGVDSPLLYDIFALVGGSFLPQAAMSRRNG